MLWRLPPFSRSPFFRAAAASCLRWITLFFLFPFRFFLPLSVSPPKCRKVRWVHPPVFCEFLLFVLTIILAAVFLFLPPLVARVPPPSFSSRSWGPLPCLFLTASFFFSFPNPLAPCPSSQWLCTVIPYIVESPVCVKFPKSKGLFT